MCEKVECKHNLVKGIFIEGMKLIGFKCLFCPEFHENVEDFKV